MRKTIWLIVVLTILILCVIYYINGASPFGILPRAMEINLPPPELMTDQGGIYSQTSWDLDLMKYNYTRPADNPTAPGDVFKPDITGKTKEKVPVIGEYTLQASEDRSVNTMGMNFYGGLQNSSNTKVWIYRQTNAGNPKLYEASTLGVRDDYLIATIDKDEPYGVYLMWIENQNGVSLPVRINAAHMTWIGPDHALQGNNINIYGRNLSHNNDTLESYVYIRPWGTGPEADSKPVSVTKVNPYKVTFTLPSDVITGSDYEVWVHNGHGGQYGWSGPMKLHIDVSDPYVWDGNTINVDKYGAKGDGIADDSKSIQDAVDAASNGDIIYFPSGKYRLVHSPVVCDKKISFEGAGMDGSIIMTDSAFSDTQMFFIRNFPARIRNLGFSTSKPDQKGLRILVQAEGSNENQRSNGFIVNNSSFKTAAFGGNAMVVGYGINCISVEHVDDALITHNVFTTQVAVNGYDCEGMVIRHNKIYGNWKVTRGNGNLETSFPGDIQRLDMSKNDFQGIDHMGPVKDGDRLLVRAIVFQNWHGGSHNRIYLGANNIDRAGNPWDNSGEVILFEVGASKRIYKLVSLEGESMTLNISRKKNSLVGETIAIIKNKGLGQFRRIIANEDSHITIDRPWDIPPDTSSVFSYNTSMDNCVIYKNNIVGIPNYFEQESATSGIQLYGSCFENIVADNTFRFLHHGIYIQGFTGYPTTESLSTGSMGNLITGNTVSDVVYGLESIVVMYRNVIPKMRPLPDIPWSSNVNNVFRDNNVSNIRTFTVDGVKHGGYGIIIGQLYNDWQNPVWNGPWVREILVEHNIITDAASKYVWLRQHQEYTTIRKNTFIDNNKYENTTGIYFSPENKNATVIGNTISKNIDIAFGGAVPDHGIQKK